MSELEKIKRSYTEGLQEDYVYDKRLAYLMTNLLKGVVQNGTGRNARYVSSFIGGKTGTTNNYVDAWFLGFSHNLTLGVWTGFDNNQTLGWAETGSKSALPVWAKYMDSYLKKYGELDFTIPSGILNVRVNTETGKLADTQDNNTHMEAFVAGTELSTSEQNTQKISEEEVSQFEEDDYYTSQ